MVDVAATWVLLASGEVDMNRLEALIVRAGRKVLLNAYLKPFSQDRVVSVLGEVVAWKSQDPHMTALEVSRMRALL